MTYDGAVLADLIGKRPRKPHIIAVRECRSTNDLVHETFADPAAPDAVLAVADYQQSGQGRQGRTWYSLEGKDVLMTLGVRLDRYQVRVDSRLPLAIAVLVARGIKQATGVQLRTKWPNDLVDREGRKVCGILIRNRTTHFAVGVGINVNSRREDYPADIRARVGTLCEVRGEEAGRAELVGAVARELLDFFEGNTGDTLESLIEQWTAHTATFALPMLLHQDGNLVEVTPLRLIAETGELVVRHKDGREETLSSAALIEP